MYLHCEQAIPAGEVNQVVIASELHEREQLQQAPAAVHAVEAPRVFLAMQGARIAGRR